MSIKITSCLGGILLLLICFPARAQVVFTYGNSSVDKAAFLRAYSKNNPGRQVSEKSVRDYLDLMIRFKLKVKEAYAKKLDTLASQKSELAEFRRQIADNFLKDDNGFRDLVEEAFSRSQRDINIAYLFIPVPPLSAKNQQATGDTLAGRKLAMKAYEALQKGESFQQVAARYSTSAGAKTNAGDPGFVTVFTLPYEFENVVYGLPAGGLSKPVASGNGYYIFKNLGTRKAVGKIRVRQVLLTMPPGTDSSLVASIRRKADSIYEALAQGTPFDSVTTRFWSAGLASGELPVFGVGTYEPSFEKAVFALQKDGDVTRPLRTALGFHVVQRVEAMPVDENANEASLEMLKQQVMADPRMNLSKNKLRAAVSRAVPVQTASVNQTAVWQFADSMFAGSKAAVVGLVHNNTVLFSIGRTTVTVGDWINFMRARNRNAVPTAQLYPALLQEFKHDMALTYYQDHLEDYNADYAAQVQEFREGNLLFEIMQRYIWERAAADSLALKKYYEKHRSRYLWLPGAEAVIFTARDSVTAFAAYSAIRQHPSNWKELVLKLGDRIQADSGRFELAQLSMKSLAETVAGTMTPPRGQEGSEGYIFSYIIRPATDPSPRSFEDARGFVTNDYQAFLEDEWIRQLKIKYPVTVNEAVVRSLYTGK